ncbi:hypothetical protein EBT16_07985, partial [bacterium]|nr:hypothetical protein [bacterium]
DEASLPLTRLTSSNNDGEFYRVLITTKAGESAIYSEPVRLTVPLPVITLTQGLANTVASKQKASFSIAATATGGARLSFDWQKKSKGSTTFSPVSGVVENNPWPGSGSSSLPLEQLTNAADNGTVYKVIVSADLGASSVTSTATLTVNVPSLTILAHPANRIAVDGKATFTVTVKASDDSELTYQWQKQESTGGAFKNFREPSLDPELTVSNLTNASDNLDVYRVVITAQNGESRVTSSSATLQVPKSTISIDSQPQNQGTASGLADFTVSATITQGASLSYQWQKSIDNGATFRDLPGQTDSTLSLIGVSSTDNHSRYRVILSGTNGATSVTSDSATLIVGTGIIIVNQPTNQTSLEGGALFSVLASSSTGAAITYQWQRKARGTGNFVDLLAPASSLVKTKIDFDTQSQFENNFVITKPVNGFAAVSDGGLYFSNPKVDQITKFLLSTRHSTQMVIVPS